MNRWACLMVAITLCCFAARADWKNSLKPAGKPDGEIVVVKAGVATGRIQVPADPTPQESKAASELQHWIHEISGGMVPISSDSGEPAVIAIRTDKALADEAYAIAVQDGVLVLSGGKTRGVINAVYALLEEDLGCRFYANDSIKLPQSDALILAPVARTYAPRLKVRDPYYKCAFDATWSLRNRTNSPAAAVAEEHGGHIDYGKTFVHTAAQMVPPGKYFKQHPEYFASQPNGTTDSVALCATHPEVADIVTSYVLEALRENPNIEIVSVSKNDTTVVCHCDRCDKLRVAEGSDMANQLVLVNHVAEAVEREYPDVMIDTLAYLETIQVPKSIRPRKNVVIRLCNDNVGSWSKPFTPARECDIAKLVSAWSAVHNRIYIWDYNVNFSHYLAPMPNIDVMADNIRFWVSNNAEGVMLQGGYQGPAERDELKCWVTAKLLWNPDWDEKALTEDFISGHYGKAAKALAQYEALLDRMRADHADAMANPAGGIRYAMDSKFITRDFVTTATEIFAQALKVAQDDERLVRKVERAMLPVLYVKCVRGPEFTGGGYAQVVADFERIARREGIEYLQEGGKDFEDKLSGFKRHLPNLNQAS